MNHALQCRCGRLKGVVSHTRTANRGVCYCRDCQAYAHFLGEQADVLDADAGTDVVAILPAYVTIHEGIDALVCMSLSEKGLLRWYASFCNTAIGNTSRDYRMAYVGLVHACLRDPARTLEDSFGVVRMRIAANNAKTPQRPLRLSQFIAILRLMRSMIGARLSGAYKTTPFFVADSGAPIVAPTVLSASERDRLMKAL